MGDQDYLLAFQSVIMPIATEFAPEMVISRFIYIMATYLYQLSAKLLPALTQPTVTRLGVATLLLLDMLT